MKKRILKIGLFVLGVVIIVFLLLPFLETDSTQTKYAGSEAKPQIASENPLTKLAKRFAALFGRKERSRNTLSARTTPPEEFPDWEALYAARPTQTDTDRPSPKDPAETITLPPTQAPFDYADASFQADNGEWVLIRQTAPQSSVPGMHEVNVHDNPYDRYLKQERARRFQPSMNTREIPDSKWARLTRPLKHFFSGNESPHPVSSTSVRIFTNTTDTSHMLAASQGKGTQGLGTNGAKNLTPGPLLASLPNISPMQWAQLTPEEREKITERYAAHEFDQLLSGDRAAEQAAEIAADAKYPNPKNKQEEQEKERYKQQLTEENKQKIREGLLAHIQANAAGKEATDELSYMTDCKDSSLPNNSGACSATGETLPPTRTPQEQLLAQQTQNTQTFFERTQYVLPQGLPFTVVLGPTEPGNLQHMVQNPATEQTGEIYQFMYERQQCASRTCYWVPNSAQVDPQLTDAFFTVNKASLKTDPQQTYSTYAEPFVQEKISKLGTDATPEQVKQIAKQAQEQFISHRPNWVPYTEEQLLQMHQDTKDALTAPVTDLSGKDPVFPFVTDPAIAPQIAELIGPASFVYNNTSLINSTTSLEAGEQMTDSLVQNVNDAKEVFNEVTQGAINEGIRSQINQQISNQNKTGGGFAGLLNLFKSTRQK